MNYEMIYMLKNSMAKFNRVIGYVSNVCPVHWKCFIAETSKGKQRALLGNEKKLDAVIV